MTSLLHIKILKMDKFRDFSCDIDYSNRTVVFRDVIFGIINQCDPRRPKGASGGHKVSASCAAQASEARLYILTIKTRLMFVCLCIYTKRTKVFQHLIFSHTNNTKMGLFMKRVTSKRYGIQLIGFQIRIIRIQISYRLIFLINH